MVEIPKYPFIIATQFHPEFKSRPNHAQPLFRGMIQAAVNRSKRLYPRQSEIPQAHLLEMAEMQLDAMKDSGFRFQCKMKS